MKGEEGKRLQLLRRREKEKRGRIPATLKGGRKLLGSFILLRRKTSRKEENFAKENLSVLFLTRGEGGERKPHLKDQDRAKRVCISFSLSKGRRGESTP